MRIFVAKLGEKMKTRLNLTIDQALLESMKAYAANKHTSVFGIGGNLL